MASTRLLATSLRDSDVVIDSGASEHIVCDQKYFWELSNAEEISIEVAEGRVTKAKEKVTIRVRLHDGMLLIVTNVYYVPEMRMNLLSCAQLVDKGISVMIFLGHFEFLDRDRGNSLMGYTYQ